MTGITYPLRTGEVEESGPAEDEGWLSLSDIEGENAGRY